MIVTQQFHRVAVVLPGLLGRVVGRGRPRVATIRPVARRLRPTAAAISEFAARRAELEKAAAEKFANAQALGEKRGPVLFQLPPFLKKDLPKPYTMLYDLTAMDERRERGARRCAHERPAADEPPRMDTAAQAAPSQPRPALPADPQVTAALQVAPPPDDDSDLPTPRGMAPVARTGSTVRATMSIKRRSSSTGLARVSRRTNAFFMAHSA